MAKTTLDMVKEFEACIEFVQELQKQDDECWNNPIAEGKWTVKDIISHMMLWDQYFYNEGINMIRLGQPVTVRHLNFDEFNARVIEYARTQTKDAISDQFIEHRMKIINAMSDLTEEECVKKYKDGDGKSFSIRGFLRGFIPHDKHHKKQIERYIKTVEAN